MTHYGYDGSNVVREWSENTAGVKEISATYLLGANGAMYKRGSLQADVRWYVYDGLGSVVGEVDVNGTMLATKQTDVYGVKGAGGTTGTAKSRHGWQGGVGHFSDEETGLVYMRARYYDPAIGRFISEDPGRQGANWFAYCDNNPTNHIDESGTLKRLPLGDDILVKMGIGLGYDILYHAPLERQQCDDDSAEIDTYTFGFSLCTMPVSCCGWQYRQLYQR